MPLRLEEVDPDELRKAGLLNRARTPEARAIYQILFELEPGDAKAIIAEDGEDIVKLRGQLQNCAKRTEQDLRIVPDPESPRVVFTLNPTGLTKSKRQLNSAPSAQDSVESQQRRDWIRESALELGRAQPVISAQEVVDHLSGRGIALDMSRPGTAVSAVIRNMKEFERVAQSQFRHIGD